MSDHRIRLTDRDIELARNAAAAMCQALAGRHSEVAFEYQQLADRLAYTEAGGQPIAVRKARRHFMAEDRG
jgi:hypothetical protein